jgi:Flp pilus assembly pilin Flp
MKAGNAGPVQSAEIPAVASLWHVCAKMFERACPSRAPAGPSRTKRADLAGSVARIIRDTRGAVMVEYTVLIGAVALIGSVGFIAVGIAVVKNFAFVRGMLLCPIP